MYQQAPSQPPGPSVLSRLVGKAAHAAGHLAATGAGAAIASDTAIAIATEHYGTGCVGQQLIGPVAGVAGGIVGSAAGSAVFQSLPTTDAVDDTVRAVAR